MSQSVTNPFVMQVPLKKDEVLCIGCFKPVSKAFALTGKIIKGINFIQKVTEELTWNPVTNKAEVEMVSKNCPVHSYTKGFICESCGSDYRTVDVHHRDGSKSWKPVVVLDPSPTLNKTLNPGESRVSTMTPPPDDGFGFESQLREEEIDVPSYAYFSGKRSKLNSSPLPSRSTRTATVRNSKSESQLNAEARR